MAVYLVQGKLGTGKSKYVVGKIREALLAGRRVATNIDLDLSALLPSANRSTVSRVPDKPTPEDLDSVGHGNPGSYDEERNGVMVLDELGSWLNSRTYAGKGRQDLVDWLIHARKKGWDVYLLVQSVSMIDKQVRDGMVEYLIRCIRADKIRIPVVGRMLGKKGYWPRVHIANVSIADVPGLVIDRDWFRGDDLHNAYDTRQIFRDWKRDPDQPGYEFELMAGPHSVLSAWHLKGRYQPVMLPRTPMQRLFNITPAPTPPLKPKLRLVQMVAKLPPDDAWRYARRLAQIGYSG